MGCMSRSFMLVSTCAVRNVSTFPGSATVSRTRFIPSSSTTDQTTKNCRPGRISQQRDAGENKIPENQNHPPSVSFVSGSRWPPVDSRRRVLDSGENLCRRLYAYNARHSDGRTRSTVCSLTSRRTRQKLLTFTYEELEELCERIYPRVAPLFSKIQGLDTNSARTGATSKK